MNCPNDTGFYLDDLGFNPASSYILHIDINSCFASIEQQANPFLRGKPIAVAAYDNPWGCIIAPSIEAKNLGIKVGMRVNEARKIYPDLTILTPDPWKYRTVHLALRKILFDYTDKVTPKSIDEFVLNLEGYLSLKNLSIKDLALEIKKRIKTEIGEWIKVSVGIAPNRFLAKLASSLHKPDGLDQININNFQSVYSKLKLTDICGIKERNALRLNSVGIFSVLDFYNASFRKLKAAFNSINGYYWYLRLRGWEIDDILFSRKSYGNSFALPMDFKSMEELSLIVIKLVEKTSSRLRKAGFMAQGVHLGVSFKDYGFWHKGVKTVKALFDARDIYKEIFKILTSCPFKKPVREISVSVFNLLKNDKLQLELFDDVQKKDSLVKSLDSIDKKWGDFTIGPAKMIYSKKLILDRIAFGGVKELEEFTLA